MTMSSHQSARSVTDVWLTPPEWIEALGGASTFDCVPVALVAYGEDDAAVLVNCGIPGAYVGEWSMSKGAA